MRKGGKILFVLPHFVFLGKKTKSETKIYYEIFNIWELSHFDIVYFLRLVIRAAAEPFTHHYENLRNKWKGHVASSEEKKAHAKRRINDWEKKIGIPSVKSAEISPELSQHIIENKTLLLNMIEYCRENNLIPVLLIPPVSSIMKEKVADNCLKKYLFEPSEDIATKTGVLLLNYYISEEFENIDLYLNSDCLNERGRKIFTERVLQDLKKSN